MLLDTSPQWADLAGRLSTLLVPFFPMFRRLAARFRVDSLRLISTESRSPILYLRAFSHDLQSNPYGLLKRPSEMILRSALSNVGPLVSVGRPDEALSPLGAARIYLPQGEWQERVAELMRLSRLVVIETGNASLHSSISDITSITYRDYPEGLKWEMLTAASDVKPGRALVSFLVTVQVPWAIALDKLRRIGYRMVDECAASRSAGERSGAGERTASPRVG